MKKLAIAASSVALAAMPVVGAFAANLSTTDKLTVTVGSGCAMVTRAQQTAAFGNVAPGDSGNPQSTSAMTISCNGAWKVTPSTEGLASSDKTTITSANPNDKGSQFFLALAPGNTDGGNGGTISNAFSSATGIDGKKVVSGTAAANAVTLTPTYTINIGGAQEAGSYEGIVTYTLALNS